MKSVSMGKLTTILESQVEVQIELALGDIEAGCYRDAAMNLQTGAEILEKIYQLNLKK